MTPLGLTAWTLTLWSAPSAIETAVVVQQVGSSTIAELRADAIEERLTEAIGACGDLLALGRDETRALADRVLQCAGSTTCVGARLAAEEVAMALIAVVNLELSPPLATIQLVAGPSGKVLATGIVEYHAGFAARLKDETLTLLEGAGYRAGARLVVVASPADAKIALVDGPALLSGQGVVLPPGPVRIAVEASGHESKVVDVRLERGATARVEVVLDSTGGLVGEPWFWGAIGGSVAVAAAVAVVALVVGNHTPRYFLCQGSVEQCEALMDERGL